MTDATPNVSPAVATPAATPSPAATATPTPASSDNSGVPADVSSILKFDFFGPSDDSAAKPDGGATPPQAQVADGTDGASSKPATPAAPQAPVESPEMKLLKDQLAAQAAELDKLRTPAAPVGGQPAGQAGEQSEAGGAEVPDYTFTFPEVLVNQLNSEDPRDQVTGLTNLTKGVAQGIHQTIRKEMMEQFAPRIIQATVRVVQQQMAQAEQQRQIKTDFFGKYPEFNKPELQPLLGPLAVQVAKETGAQGWSDAFRDAVANRLRAVLGVYAGAGAGSAPAGQPPLAPAGGARPAAPTNDIAAQIAEVFS